MHKCAVVILNWNGKHFLEKFLPSILQHTSAQSKIIIADNASSDGSVEYLQTQYPQVQLICLDKNYGFTGGYNRAFQQVQAEYYILLNSDVEVTQNWDVPLLETLDSMPEAGAVMPKMLSYFDRHEFEYAGAAGGFLDKYGYPFCRGRVYHTLEHDSGQYDGLHEIFWATGACIAVRSNIYHQLGGLDDLLFAHMEEIDLCWRMHHIGYKVYMNSASVVYHLGGGTLPKYSPQKSYLNFRNNLIVLYKNLPASKHNKIYIIRLFLDFVAAGYFLAHLNFSGCYIVFKAHVVFLYYRFTGKIKKEKKLTSVNPFLNVNTVNQYFIKGNKTFLSIVQKNDH